MVGVSSKIRSLLIKQGIITDEQWEEARREGDPPELVAVCDRVREVLGWQPRHDDLDTIVRTSLDWERKIAAGDPGAYWGTDEGAARYWLGCDCGSGTAWWLPPPSRPAWRAVT